MLLSPPLQKPTCPCNSIQSQQKNHLSVGQILGQVSVSQGVFKTEHESLHYRAFRWYHVVPFFFFYMKSSTCSEAKLSRKRSDGFTGNNVGSEMRF